MYLTVLLITLKEKVVVNISLLGDVNKRKENGHTVMKVVLSGSPGLNLQPAESQVKHALLIALEPNKTSSRNYTLNTNLNLKIPCNIEAKEGSVLSLIPAR